ncbi:hypothetical protein [Paenibacillus aestuarii]|uniref:Uncharacterized protein n=1 Tax=Paenibacillus aestuarii TaxID=516965 RepID=A0ABW0K129_9BACL|nr:hypothetical protein [Paenibacillus aestuarii]
MKNGLLMIASGIISLSAVAGSASASAPELNNQVDSASTERVFSIGES